MKISRAVLIILLALLLLWLFTLLPGAHAQGPIAPPPPPATPPTNPVDAANAEAKAWELIVNQTIASSQAAIGQAYNALSAAEAGLAQAQLAVQQEHAARVAAEQGQIQQAVVSSQAALVAANQAAASASASNTAAVASMRQSLAALSDVRELQTDLRQRDATIAGLTAANQTQQARIVQLEDYSWAKYRETIIAWALAGLLGFVVLAGLLALVIIVAMERRNRWPRLKRGLAAALVVPLGQTNEPTAES